MTEIEQEVERMEKRYIIYMTDRKDVCPSCSGIALLQEDFGGLWCIDCHEVFKIQGEGNTDKEVICVKFA